MKEGKKNNDSNLKKTKFFEQLREHEAQQG